MPSEDSELAFAGIARQAEMLRRREVSSPELVRLYLDRIRHIDPKLNAYRIVMAERALEEAAAAQVRLDAGETAPLLVCRSASRIRSTLRASSLRMEPMPSVPPRSMIARWFADFATPVP